MQGRRGFLKKLKFNPTKINTLKQGLAFHQHTVSNQNCKTNNVDVKDRKDDELDVEHPCLTDFEEKCPPGGENAVVFYTTSLRGIRKTFEDCSRIKFLLDSFKVSVHERDVSMDKGFREELWNMLGGRVIPPKLFVKGRYIGGADEVVGLHEQGKLKKLLEEMPSSGNIIGNNVCSCCGNLRFLICSSCNGSRKVYEEKGCDHDHDDDDDGDDDDHHHHEFCIKRCNDCNENGLIKCPSCS
ncbi:ubiquitin carboxyl-terminal hydrolase 8-like [Hibiscus syriacus]|uniref:Ubiquitin carboxyl-terminal hydrolase 8-like n=2 Tax=Hibiscus syriacus TaxID=106335 RepID=A0A6A2XA78_HIBSY|nr:ubiquitin carboxyl-terminal hydrolase 8-like [Hibiscus syriacus]